MGSNYQCKGYADLSFKCFSCGNEHSFLFKKTGVRKIKVICSVYGCEIGVYKDSDSRLPAGDSFTPNPSHII